MFMWCCSSESTRSSSPRMSYLIWSRDNINLISVSPRGTSSPGVTTSASPQLLGQQYILKAFPVFLLQAEVNFHSSTRRLCLGRVFLSNNYPALFVAFLSAFSPRQRQRLFSPTEHYNCILFSYSHID